MAPVDAARWWGLPALETSGALAEWLQLSLDELAWFADLKGMLSSRCDAPLVHYRYRLLTKSSGGFRLLEAPKPRLKELQRQVLSGILERVPAHPAVHGFCKGRSIKTFATPHAGCRVVLKMDLSDFFPSFRAARVAAFFRTCGYPETVAELLTGLCTNQVPRSLWRGGRQDIREARDLYCRPHLPQGAPTSPALANACAYRLDLRLSGLPRSAGAAYTRYADDLAFSGDGSFERCVDRFAAHVAAVAHDEGFSVHHRKTRVMRQGVRQHLAGLVTNEGVNIIRADFDRLKATLHNCVRHGPANQNRDNHPHYRLHLEGRVAFVEMLNPAKAARLRDLLARISW
jgi:RNA-directed DNA polymerase